MPRTVPAYTISDPTVNDITQIVIRKEVVGGQNELRLSSYYVLQSDAPGVTVDQESESYSIVLPAGIKAQLVTFIDNNVIPGIIVQEGL